MAKDEEAEVLIREVRTLADNLSLTNIAVNAAGEKLGLTGHKLAGVWQGLKLLAAGIQEANAFQKQSLGINRTLSQTIGKNSYEIASLTGGLYENAQSVLALQRAGFDKLNPRVAQLSTFMRTTGQSTAGLIEQSRLLYNQGGLTENSINALAGNLMYNTAQYNISTTELIGAVNQLSGKMATFGMLGITGPLSEAVTDLTGRMGAQFGDSIGKFASMMADPSTSSNLLTRLGLYDMARDIRLGKVDDKKLLEAIQQASKGTEGFTGDTAGLPGEVFSRMLGIAGGEGGLGQLGVQLGREEVAPEGGPTAILQSLSELGTIFAEIVEPMKIAVAGIFDFLVPVLKFIAPTLRKLALIVFPALIARLTFATAKLIWSTAVATGRFVKQQWEFFSIKIALGKTRAALERNTLRLRAAGAGSIIGALVSIGVGVAATVAAVKASGKIDEDLLKMQQDANLEEQRKQAKAIPRTAGFLAMAKAISADAGLAMAFRPDVLDPARRDDIMREAIEWLEDIARGVHTSPSPDIKFLLGGIK